MYVCTHTQRDAFIVCLTDLFSDQVKSHSSDDHRETSFFLPYMVFLFFMTYHNFQFRIKLRLGVCLRVGVGMCHRVRVRVRVCLRVRVRVY